MLPKRLSKKDRKPTDSQQLKLGDGTPVKQKLFKKRSFLLVTLGLTVGLSIVFSFYRTISSISFRPRFSFSGINKNKPTTPSKPAQISLSKPITTLLPQPNDWAIYVKTLKQPPLSWSLNFPLPLSDSIVNNLLVQKDISDSLIKNSIPQGSQVKENIISLDGFLTYQTIISVPKQQILIIIKAKDEPATSQLIPQLVKTIYWLVIQN